MSLPSSSISVIGSYQPTSKKQNKEIILQNPFHPLDLSPYDLLQIYKRFQQSRKINRNPKQEIPIQVIAQLISSLKGCKPSYIQKCMSQALIKNTISWNDFLKFLDQQSQVREKILQWLLYQSYTFKYHFKNYYPFRAKIEKSYQFMTFLKIIEFGDQLLLLCSVDQFKLLLIDITQKNFHQLDRYVKVNPKTNLQEFDMLSLNNSSNSKSIRINAYNRYVNADMSSKCLKPNKKPNQKSSFSQKLIPLSSYNYKSNQISNNQSYLEDQEIYFKKQRKNINNVFTVFKDLGVEDSIGLAKITAAKIGDRSFNTNFANSIKQTFSEKIVQYQEKPKQIPVRKIPNIDKVKSKLKSLYQEKSKLSYNPYRVKKSMSVMQQQDSQLNQNKFGNKKMNNANSHDRKEKNYFLQSMHQTYNDQLKSLAIVYYNMEVVLLRIGKDYNKFCFQQMDTIRIHRERDHKKNEIIQSISLYYHSIIGKWMLLVLIRVQYKTQSKVHSQSYLVGYQLLQQQNKRKGGFNYSFKANKKPFNGGSLSQIKKQTFSLRIDNFQAIAMQIQPKYGIHLISYNGKYITYRQQYKQNEDSHCQNQYWKFSYQQRFKDNNFSLSCLAINPNSNKIIFGTAKGVVIIYDIFSHNFKLKKLSSASSFSFSSSSSSVNSAANSSSIINVFIKNNQGYILTANERLVVMDLNKFEQIDDFSVRNDQKLHQKVKGFQIFKNNIMTYGSQLKLYDQEIDQIQLHKKRMMENMYTWRLNKLKKTTLKTTAQRSTHIQMKKQLKSSQLVISSDSYFIILSQILEIIVINKLTMTIKFSFILSIPHDSKIMKMTLSPNQKLIAILLLNQNIYIFNIYTQDQYAHIKPSNTHKFVALSFLDEKNQYLLAAGTQNGKIALIPYESVPQKPIKDLNYHQNSVTTLEVRKDFMITAGEGGRKIGIWQLPFNAIKHQIKLIDTSNYITRCIGYYLNRSIYFKTLKNDILELSITSFKITQIKLPKKYSLYQVDSLTNKIVAIYPTSIQHPNQCILSILEKDKDMTNSVSSTQKDAQGTQSKFKQTFSLNLTLQSEVIQIGIIGSEKAVLFCQGGGAYVFSFQNEKLGKYITF